jgi:hypothetical protein
MLRPSPVSRLLAARDMVYAHFQLQMECISITKRREVRVARKLAAKQTIFKGVAMIEEKEKEQAKVGQKEIKQSPEDEEETELDLECQGFARPEPPLYVTSDNFFGRMKQTFNDARSRRALVCASTATISQQLTGINTIGERFQTSKYSERQSFALSYSNATNSSPETHAQHTLSKLTDFLCIVFLSNTLLRTVNASERTGAWVGFGIGICNFVYGTRFHIQAAPVSESIEPVTNYWSSIALEYQLSGFLNTLVARRYFSLASCLCSF